MIAHNQRYKDTRITLDGATFVGCTFENCIFVFSGLLPPLLEGNTITACKWEFTGPAANTVAFMSALYRSGAHDVIEKTFENIRNMPDTKRAGDPVILN